MKEIENVIVFPGKDLDTLNIHYKWFNISIQLFNWDLSRWGGCNIKAYFRLRESHNLTIFLIQ